MCVLQTFPDTRHLHLDGGSSDKSSPKWNVDMCGYNKYESVVGLKKPNITHLRCTLKYTVSGLPNQK